MNNCVLYYSNSCPHSVKLLQELKKTNAISQIQFISIDQRVKGQDGKIRIVLQNGKQVLMPPNLTSTPGLMLIDKNYQILYGDQIYTYLQGQIQNARQYHPQQNPSQQQQYPQQQQPTSGDEPSAFSFSGGNSGFVVSDAYSFLDQDLSFDKDGFRQMHHYESLTGTMNPQQNLHQQVPNDNIRQSNNRIREGEVDAYMLAQQRGYSTAGGAGMLR